MTLAGYVVFLNAMLFVALIILLFVAFASSAGDAINPLIIIPALLIGMQLVVGTKFFDEEYTLEIKQNGNSIQSK